MPHLHKPSRLFPLAPPSGTETLKQNHRGFSQGERDEGYDGSKDRLDVIW